MRTRNPQAELSQKPAWNAVGSMALCVALLIASEFMPVSLLTPIARDFGTTEGAAGQGIAISGLFAIVTSFFIATVAGRFDRRNLLMVLTGLMLVSLIVIAEAPNLTMFMIARALLGIVIGGFWSLATATVMRLVPQAAVAKALALLYTGNAVATAFAAPIGSYVGSLIGWRGVFLALVPIVLVNLAWQCLSLPHMPAQRANPVSKLFGLLKRRNVALAMLAIMLSFGGAYATFTYLRPFLETYTHVSVSQLSLLLLGLGIAGFAGTSGAGALVSRRLSLLLGGLPLALAAITIGLLLARSNVWGVAIAMFAWGAVNAALPVAWATWLTRGIGDEPESGGGLMVGAIQLSITLGATIGGVLLDRVSIDAAFFFGAAILVLAAASIGNGKRLMPAENDERDGERHEAVDATSPSPTFAS